MPVIHISALPQPDPSVVQAALTATCVAVSQVYGCDERAVWAVWHPIEPGAYVEGRVGAETQPADTHPPICEIWSFEGRSEQDIEKILTTLAESLSQALRIPNNVFAVYRDLRSGRVIAGNGVIRR